MYDWNFNVIWDYRMVYMRGALITLELSLLAVVFSMSLGLFVGIARQECRHTLIGRLPCRFNCSRLGATERAGRKLTRE